jgi:hypothetical protein
MSIKIIKEREKTHGDFMLKATFIHEFIENITDLYSWKDLEPDQKEAIHMIMVKLSRILYGNPNHTDHWDDISGYALLVSERLRKETKPIKEDTKRMVESQNGL